MNGRQIGGKFALGCLLLALLGWVGCGKSTSETKLDSSKTKASAQAEAGGADSAAKEQAKKGSESSEVAKNGKTGRSSSLAGSDPADKDKNPGIAMVSDSEAVKAPASGTAASTKPAAGLTAKEVLAHMAAAYKKAAGYADKGTLRIRGGKGTEKIDQSVKYSVVLARPNKLRMHMVEGVVVSDGKQFCAFANQVPNQVIRRPVGAKLTLKDLLSDMLLVDAISPEMTRDVSMVPIQLLLLLADDPLKTLLHRSEPAKLIEPAKIDEVACDRVELTRTDGKAVLWIDRETSILRRLEFPTEALMRMARGAEKVENLTLVADFIDARFEQQVDESAFQFDVPEGTQALEALMPPPLLLVGKKSPEFSFKGADDKRVTLKSLDGKVVVVDFWATWCGPCRAVLPTLGRVAKKYKDNDKVTFLAVSVDNPETPDKEIRELLKELEPDMSLVRDLDQDAGKKFGVNGIPAIFLIDGKGVVQGFYQGMHPGLENDLGGKIKKILAGEKVSDEQLHNWQEQRKQHTDWLERWYPQGLFVMVVEEQAIPEAKILPKSEPKAFALTSLWKSADVKSPGNVLAFSSKKGTPTILVIDGFKSIVELGPDGKAVATHPLDLGERDVVTFLRTAVDKEGKRYFATSGITQQQVLLLDEAFKKLASFPENVKDNPHAGISDVEFGDLEGDGVLKLYVGYFGDVGVQAVSLSGKRLWSHRSLSQVSRLAVAKVDDKQLLLCTNSTGALALLDAKGDRKSEIRVPNRLILWIAAGSTTEGGEPTELASLYQIEMGANVFIGTNAKGEELWNYPLPKGMHRWPVEQIVFGHLTPGKPGQWLLPGADGSVHVFALDGKPIDQFRCGVALTGLTTTAIDGKPVLITASAEGVEAWKVEWKTK